MSDLIKPFDKADNAKFDEDKSKSSYDNTEIKNVLISKDNMKLMLTEIRKILKDEELQSISIYKVLYFDDPNKFNYGMNTRYKYSQGKSSHNHKVKLKFEPTDGGDEIIYTLRDVNQDKIYFNIPISNAFKETIEGLKFTDKTKCNVKTLPEIVDEVVNEYKENKIEEIKVTDLIKLFAKYI